ncbi:hypothetical protein BGZ80_001033 [Entomortierella chlamydospora]|uniref:Uncharacterized protein n=1 Tax=Entomortierella chlamydospora TaxID=101097 RepID=A0A9P6MRC8_9FUNG|nr:hypothetical protein BGZ79_002463 [Entomortierella chlamydospora]KAG0010984.1 hypothetical protein BGZ80_001033 [Entomortierella chlamydospora]
MFKNLFRTKQSPIIRPGKATRDSVPFPNTIFAENVDPPIASCALPELNKQLIDTPQLAYCLKVLNDEVSDDSAKQWRKDTIKDFEELKRFSALVRNVVRAFESDELKDADAISEVTYLAPFLGRSDFRFLLAYFVDGLEHSMLLDLNSLEGIARLMQSADPSTLNADDLVRTLDCINKRMHLVHGQSEDYVYHMTTTVSRVLDAMADSHVKGLKREDLHEPLSAYLEGLKGHNDPYIVFQAAYAFQALQCVPDDESPWQAGLRKGSGIVKGATKDAYDKVKTLYKSGQDLRKALKDGLSFDKKCAWYTALRGTDVLLQNGQLSDFKKIVCEAPCRRALPFQWGVCQRLGNLAFDPLWDGKSRRGAIEFLGQLYRDDENWGHHVPIKQLILDILMQLEEPSQNTVIAHAEEVLLAKLKTDGEAVAQAAKELLAKLQNDGNDAKRRMYEDCRTSMFKSHPLRVVMPPPASSSLLDRVQGRLDVEADLKRLKLQRIKLRGTPVYIPPQGKAPDTDPFDLMDTVNKFLDDKNKKVFLLLGDSGVGKSTFNRELEYRWWRKYEKKSDRIPLFISLPAIVRPEQDLIAKHLRKVGFEESQIRELKGREFVLICDGYDESQQTHNLYTSNQFNQEGEWRAQMVISCRSDYVGLNYKDRFQPSDRNKSSVLSQSKEILSSVLGQPKEIIFQEAVIMPFNENQVRDYISCFVALVKPLWSAVNYNDVLEKIPSLQELVKNPFLLTLSLDVLPRLVHPDQKDFAAAKVTRAALYDEFVEQWLERGKKRLADKELSGQEKKALQSLSDDGFERNGIEFLKRLATEVYDKQGGNPVVKYSRLEDAGSWKDAFFGNEDDKQLLRDASPLTRSGNQYQFIHRSILEYGLARAVFEPQNRGIAVNEAPEPAVILKHRVSAYSFEMEGTLEDIDFSINQGPDDKSPLFRRIFIGEPSIMHFLEERVQQEPVFRKQLLEYIESSKHDKKWRTAAANAITILVRAGERFNGADLKGIQIPRADLSGGQFDSAQLEGSDLRKVDLRNIWLRQANLSKARMEGIEVGAWQFLQEVGGVGLCTFSPDGKTSAFGLLNGTICVYDTATWMRTHTLQGHTGRVKRVAYSPSSQQIVSGGFDKTVRLWNAQTGAPGPVLRGHTEPISSVLYSPSGQQVISGSWDKTVRLWDATTGASCLILSGHTSPISSVAYSPSGSQIASGSWDRTVRLWDAVTGELDSVLKGTSCIMSLAYSPSGQQIASGSWDKTVQLWDAQTGARGPVLNGHTDSAESVVYSPNGRQIASGSWDNTVRLWDAQTGTPGPILSGHTRSITSVVYSPNGRQIASSSRDNTVRLWDSETGASSHILSGHAGYVVTVAYSPCGQQIASGSWDRTVRLWDAHSGKSIPILGGHTGDVVAVAYSPCGQQIASGSRDSTVRLWDASSGTFGPILCGHTSGILSLAYSPSGQKIASGSWDQTVRVWDSQTSKSGCVLRGHTGSITSVAYSPNGQQIASGSRDETVRLWDAETGVSGLTLAGHTGWVTSVAYSPSGRQITSGSCDNTVRVWDTETGASSSILYGHTSPVLTIAYSPSGKQIASGSDDKTVRLWDAQTGLLGPVLSSHIGSVTSVVYLPSGQQIASVCGINTVQLWDVDSGQILAVTSDYYEPISSIAWKATPDGTFFVTGGNDMSVRMWQAIAGKDQYQAHLHWNTKHCRHALSNASMQSAQGFSSIMMQLLQRRGAVFEPIPFKP